MLWNRTQVRTQSCLDPDYREAGIATGWEITLQLVSKLAAVKGVDEQPDWAVWYQAEFGKAPNYSELLDALAATPTERRPWRAVFKVDGFWVEQHCCRTTFPIRKAWVSVL